MDRQKDRDRDGQTETQGDKRDTHTQRQGWIDRHTERHRYTHTHILRNGEKEEGEKVCGNNPAITVLFI